MVAALLLFTNPLMQPNSLDNFLDQLVQWTRQVIETGRTPFRKVEINPPLITPRVCPSRI